MVARLGRDTRTIGAVVAISRFRLLDRAGPLGRRLAPVVVVLLSLVATGPLFGGGMVAGHDAHEHVTRTAEYARAVASGVWWPQWAPNLGHGFGEPIFLFNPPLFYGLASLATFVDLPLVSSVNLVAALLLVLAALGMYAWAAPTFGRPAAVVAGCAYAWAPYVLLDLYVRQALTELTAVSLFPWALWGLARACRTPRGRDVAIAAVAVGLLLYSSTPATVVTGPALVGQVLVLADPRRPRGTVAGLAALALGGVLAAAFWLPAATERHLLRFDRLLAGKIAYYDHYLEPWQLVSSYWGFGMSREGPDERLMGFGLGEIQLALAAGAAGLLLLGWVRGEARRQALFALGLILVGAGLSLEFSSFVWDRVPPMQYLQYPWRFLMLPALGCAALAALPTALLAPTRPRLAIVVAVLCAGLLIAGGWVRARPRDLIPYSDDRFAAFAVAGRDRGRGTVHEYETVWTTRFPVGPPSTRLRVVNGSATVADLGGTAHEQRFSLSVGSRARLRLNTFYFPGWRVLVDGQEREIEYGNSNGLIELIVHPGDSLVVARFEPTPVRWIGRALSLAGLAAVALLLTWPRLRQTIGLARPGRRP